MRATAGAISRARARASAHNDHAADACKRGEIQCGQLWVRLHLTHAWPRASGAKRKVAVSISGARARAGERALGDCR